MKPLRIHYLQHVNFEGLGCIEAWANEHNHILSATKFYENCFFPDLNSFDCLIIMGGPMSVYDENSFNWLAREKVFIRNSIEAKKKVLGICLGAQLIAICLGAKVKKAENKEIGWFPVSPTIECKQHLWFFELFKDNPFVFHWHGDQFEIPPKDSLNLLVSDANANQAFFYGENVIGLQFHLEVTKQNIELMLEHGKNELTTSRFIQSVEDIRKGTQYIERCNIMMNAILEFLNK